MRSAGLCLNDGNQELCAWQSDWAKYGEIMFTALQCYAFLVFSLYLCHLLGLQILEV